MIRLNKALLVTCLVVLSTISINLAHSENAHQIMGLNQEMQEIGYKKGNKFNNNELTEWYEQAYSYYTDVQMGVAPKPSDKAWNEFLNQMNWAYKQLHGSSEQQSDPFGGMTGLNGNNTYDLDENQIINTGESNSHESWSNDSELIVPSMAAGVWYEPTQDNQIEPPEEVIKIVVKDRASKYTSGFAPINTSQIRLQTPHNPQSVEPKGSAITSAAIMGFGGSKSNPNVNQIKNFKPKSQLGDVGQFDSQINSMTNNNSMFLSLQSKIQSEREIIDKMQTMKRLATERETLIKGIVDTQYKSSESIVRNMRH